MIILNADDYAMSGGVSRAILALAEARKLSATSAMTTLPGWPDAAAALAGARGHLALGLHLNLTTGAPLGRLPRLAADGRLPPLGALVRDALLGRLDAGEIAAEIGRQIDAFVTHLGFPPDHVDGHQHVHVLPGVRAVLLAELARRFPGRGLLLRDPSPAWRHLRPAGSAGGKALVVKALAGGFARASRRHAFTVNDGFSGFSAFDDRRSYGEELAAAMRAAGRCHIVMCHPGYPDAELAALDPIVARRQQEFDALMADADLPARIWRPQRAADGAPIDWSKACR